MSHTACTEVASSPADAADSIALLPATIHAISHHIDQDAYRVLHMSDHWHIRSGVIPPDILILIASLASTTTTLAALAAAHPYSKDHSRNSSFASCFDTVR